MDTYKNTEIDRLNALEKKKNRYARYYSPEEIERELELQIKLKLSGRSANCLRRAGIKDIATLQDFYYRHGKYGLSMIRNVGKKTTQEIMKKMSDYGIDLSDTKQPDRCPTCGQLILTPMWKKYNEIYDELYEKPKDD